MKNFSLKSPRNHFGSVASDVQYELCNSFMKHAYDQLVQKQTQLMMETSLFLDTFPETLRKHANQNHYEPNKDLSTTLESHTLDHLLNEQEDNRSTRTNKFTRKGLNSSMNMNSLNRTSVDGSLSQCMIDVKQNCSRKTVNAINSLIAENQNLKKKLAETQPKNLGLRSTKDDSKHSYEQTIMLTAKNTKLQKQNEYLSKKIKDLEVKLGKFSDQRECNLSSSFSSSASITPTKESKSYQLDKKLMIEIKNYMEEKQKWMKNTHTSVQQIQTKIQKSIQEEIIDKGCERCCGIMKKIKGSLINYRQCFEQKIIEHQKLYEQMKKTLD